MYEDENTNVRIRKHEPTNTKTRRRKYEDENTKVRRRKHEDEAHKMIIIDFQTEYSRVIIIVSPHLRSSYFSVFAFVVSCSRIRTFVFSRVEITE